ncbi:MAG: hypothetical protein J6R20_00175 [Clostridia bacterium]|nr:hypothetical protein [Clostridia bacterium]
MFKKLFAILSLFIIIFSFAGCKEVEKGKDNGVIPASTKIANEFIGQLPEFEFSSEVVDSYSEALRYTFSVKCSNSEFKKYLKSVKNSGFVLGFPEQQPVSGDGYYKASNDKGYMVEIVYKSDFLTVDVTRP